MNSTPSASNSNKTFSLNPSSSLSLSTTYKIRINNSVLDFSGNKLVNDFTTPYGFTTTSWSGTKIFGSSDISDDALKLALNSGDNAYIVGDTQGSTENFTYQGSEDDLIYKYNNNGYITGGTYKRDTIGYEVIFLKYDSSSTFVWDKQFGVMGSADIGTGIGLDSNVNSYIVGHTEGDLNGVSNTSLARDAL